MTQPKPSMADQAATTATAPLLLEFRNVSVIYDNAIEAVRDVSISVPQGAIVALLGSNGAGKSTLLKAMSGVLYAEDGEIDKGHVMFAATDLSKKRPDEIVRAGIVQVPEGRRIFPALTVEENLQAGGFSVSATLGRERRQQIYTMFPRLAERRSQIAGYMSGGEQQMLAIGRALMAGPKLLALDEPSLGLAPMIVDRIYAVITELRRDMGVTILLVEQHAARALEIADYAYVLENGRVVLDGPSAKLARNEDVQEFYLGAGGTNGARKSMRDVKHYKRRKRWLS